MRGAAAIALILPALAGCHGVTDAAPEPEPTRRAGPPNVVRIGLERVRWPLDPGRAATDDERTLVRALLATPLRLDRAGTLRSGLCTSWRTDEGGRAFRLRCRDADTIARRLARVGAASEGWPFVAASFRAANGTLVIRLPRPWRRFLHTLAAPAAAVPGVRGPFGVVASSPGRLVAERPGLRLVFVETAPDQAVEAFRAGRLDVVSVPFGDLGALRADPALRFELRVRPLLALDVVGFDLVSGRLAGLPNTRGAYWVTANRVDYAALVAERAAPAATSLLPSAGAARPAAPRDVRDARRRIPDLPPADVALDVAPDEELAFAGEHVASTWREVGLAARVARPGEAWTGRLRRIVPPYPHPEAVLAAILIPDDRRNPWRARPSAAEAALRVALASSDPASALERADRTLAQEAAIVPLAWTAAPRLVSRRLRGWRQDALGGVDYTRVRARASSPSP